MTQTDILVKEIKKLGYEIAQTGYKDQEQIDRGEFNYRFWGHPKENYKLQGTPFYLNSENDFIHFTTLDALYSIFLSFPSLTPQACAERTRKNCERVHNSTETTANAQSKE